MRLLTLLCLVGIAAMGWLWFDSPIRAVLAIGLAITGLWAWILPNSAGPLAVIFIAAAWWFIGGLDGPWWQAAALAMVVAAFHLLSAWVATAPAYTHISARAGARLALAGSIYLAACAAGVLVVWLVTASPLPRGFTWITIALIALLSVAVLVATTVQEPARPRSS